jgi:CRP-like cAMP-binding protein
MATASFQSRAHLPQNGSEATQAAPQSGVRNKILSLLPPSELEAVLSRSETVTIESKDTVWSREAPLTHVFFPEDCVISLVTEMEDGDTVEAMTVGSDGFAGMAVFHGAPSSRLKAIGQISGTAHRMRAEDFNELTEECETFDELLHRYSQFVFETVAQSAACNRLHVIEQRCARWLLMSQDRVGRNRFDLTQEFLAEMLGVRRPGVTVAMGILEKAGLIAHTRGTISVVDRSGLEAASCECYRAIRDRQAKLIS